MSRPVSSARWASSGIAAAVDDEVGASPRRGRAQRVKGSRGSAAGDFSVELQFLGAGGFLDFLRLRHLLRGVADEQRRPAEQNDHPGQPQQAVGVAAVQRVQLGGVHELHRPSMRHALASAAAVEPPGGQLGAYATYLARVGHGNPAYEQAARSFVRRWPDPRAWAARPLAVKLQANSSTRPFIVFLMVTRRLRPGYDYLVARKLSSFWRYLAGSPLQPDLDRRQRNSGLVALREWACTCGWRLTGLGPCR